MFAKDPGETPRVNVVIGGFGEIDRVEQMDLQTHAGYSDDSRPADRDIRSVFECGLKVKTQCN